MIIDGVNLSKILKDHSTWILSKGRSGRLAELQGRNVDGANLEMANLPFADLQSASLKGALLQGSNFRKANLMQINLCGARLDGADFEGADLSGADLSFTVCKGTSFANANLGGCSFVKADLSDVNFKKADLQRANFKNASISFSDMRNANLKNVNFEGTSLNETNLTGANSKHINFKKTKPQKAAAYEAFLSDPNESELNLSEADFTQQDLDRLLSESTINIRTKTEELFVDSIAIDQAMIDEALRGLVEKLKANISDDQVKTLFKERYGIEKIDRIAFERGDVVTRNAQISFKLDFLISCSLSLLIDRRGNCTIASASDEQTEPETGGVAEESRNESYY